MPVLIRIHGEPTESRDRTAPGAEEEPGQDRLTGRHPSGCSDSSSASRAEAAGAGAGSLDARDTPLAAEWFGLFRVAPFTALGLAMVSAVAIVAAPPLVWVARGLM
jgi:hypothetical protein